MKPAAPRVLERSTTADIGVFGGSGFEHLLADADHVEIDTPYGPPSAPIAVGEMGGKAVAFLPRHGRSHEYPPHTIPYRANVWAMRELGVRRLIGPCAAGSLQRHIAPGAFVVCDQVVDRTKQRGDTFFDGAPTTHISFADPYCPELRPLAVDACRSAEVDVHDGGTVVVIEGPRFASRAESHWYSSHGWQVINMTQHPEVALAREAEMCYVNISLITDHDAGFAIDSGIAPVSVDVVLEVFRASNEHLETVLSNLIATMPHSSEATCGCGSALEGAQL